MTSHFDSKTEFKTDGSFVQLTDMGTSKNSSRSTSIERPLESVTPGSWSHDPQQLRNDRKYERLMDTYDITLCFLPLLLMGKIFVCIFAARRDKENHGVSVDLTSLWTYFLPGLNSQVSTTASNISFSRLTG
jgi:hypothetical protein